MVIEEHKAKVRRQKFDPGCSLLNLNLLGNLLLFLWASIFDGNEFD